MDVEAVKCEFYASVRMREKKRRVCVLSRSYLYSIFLFTLDFMFGVYFWLLFFGFGFVLCVNDIYLF